MYGVFVFHRDRALGQSKQLFIRFVDSAMFLPDDLDLLVLKTKYFQIFAFRFSLHGKRF